MANLKHVVTDLHQVYLTEMEAKIKPQLDKSSDSSGGSDEGEKKSDGGGDDNVKKAARQLAYDTRYKARRDGIPLERAFAQSVSNSNASAPVKDAAKAMLFSGPKEEFEVDEATAMAKRGHDETAIRNKIAANTRGGAAADRATALADKPTYGDKVKQAARERLARKQRGDFRNTTSSNPGLHGYGHKSDDPKVKAKQAARGAQRGSAALTPAERQKLNMGDEVTQTGDNIQELKKGDKEMVRVTPKKGYGKGYVRFADRKKQAELRKNPQVQSVTGTNYGEPYEGKYKLKPGETKNTKGDLDGDGTKEPDKHEYAGVKDKAIKKAVAKGEKKQDLKAHFSNWKADLGLVEETMVEVAGEEKQKKISEKSVKNTILINPELKEAVENLGGELLDVQEMTQEELRDYLLDIAEVAIAALDEAPLHPSIQRIDAINKKRAEEKRDAAAAERQRRSDSASAFQAHKKEVLAKGGRPVDALDSWQKKQIAAKKAKK